MKASNHFEIQPDWAASNHSNSKQSHYLILMCLNQSQKVTTKVLKWVITKGWNPNYCIALFLCTASHKQ